MSLPPSDSDSTDSIDVNPSSAKRGVVRRLLEPALRLWLRSQAESVHALQIHLNGSDRQIISGHLPQVSVNAEQIVYQGIQISTLTLDGQNIRINTGQILKGKALKLLDPLPVNVEVFLEADDLNSSLLNSVLLRRAILSALQTLVGEQIAETLGTFSNHELSLKEPRVTLTEDRLRFATQLTNPDGQSIPVTIETGLTTNPSHTLILQQPEWFPTPRSKRGLPLHDLDGYSFYLGKQIQIQTLAIKPEGLRLLGTLTILPD